MPRLSIHIRQGYQTTSPRPLPADEYGRSVRQVNAISNNGAPSVAMLLTHPVTLKILAGLAVLAALAMAVAIWRLFHFLH